MVIGKEPPASKSAAATASSVRKSFSSFSLGFLVWVVVVPVCVSVILYNVDPFDPAPFPHHDFSRHQDVVTPVFSIPPQWVNDRILQGAEFVASGNLLGPEDLVYDPKEGVLYTGCINGWIMRVRFNDWSIERWAYTGGRPLGLALSRHNENHLIVADALKGLLKISKEDDQEEAVIELLTDEAEGLKFKLTDGVDVADDGIIYFTDASYKYGMHEYIYDTMEGRPYGRLLSYDPVSKETKVLLRDLYFANGVALAPDQASLIFCETPMRRCSRYHIDRGDGGNASVDAFVVDLPGYPDNVHYDREGHYWIAITSAFPPLVYKAMKFRLVRKVYAIVERYIGLQNLAGRNGGTVGVDLQGKPIANLYDPKFGIITSAIKVGGHIYYGSINYQHITRISLPHQLEVKQQ